MGSLRTRLRFYGLMLWLALGAGLARTALAQTELPPDPTTTIHVRTQLVVVDAAVTDRQGKPVTGLSASDFKVFEDGQEQMVVSVDAGHAGPAKAAGPAGLASADGRVSTILVLDELNTPLADAATARASLKAYLAAQPARMTQRTMLIAIDDQGYKALVPYTTDPAALLAALSAHKARLPLAVLNSDVEKQLTLTLDVLRQLALASGGIRGRKIVLWLGTGTPGISFNNVSPRSGEAAQRVFADVTNTLLTERVVVYQIDPAAAGTSFASPLDQGLDSTFDTSPQPYAASYSFNRFVRQTGGKSFYGRNDLAAEMSQAETLGDNFYSIAYRPGPALEAGLERSSMVDYRRIRVKVDRPGLKTTAREGYFEASALPGAGRSTGIDAAPTDPANDPKRTTTVDDAMRNNLAYTGLAIAFAGDAAGNKTGDAAGQTGAHLDVRLRSSELSWEYRADGSRRVPLSFGVGVYDASGKLLHYAKGSLDAVQREADYHGKAGAPTALSVPLKGAPTGARIRLVVVDDGSGRVGSAERTLP